MAFAVFSIAEAVELGEFVLAAYDLFAAGDPPGFVLPGGYTLVSKVYADDFTDGVPDYKVFGFIARQGTDVVVALRGTEGVAEWITDFEFRLVRFPYAAAGSAERGFTGFYSTLRTSPSNSGERIVDALSDLVSVGGVASLRIGAHSLGSALATMLALELASQSIFDSPVPYTFGSPRVGDKVFAGTYDRLVETSWRLANQNDVVPQLPPQLAGYVHVDAEVPLNSDDRTRHNFRCWHAMRTYLNTLDSSVALDGSCAPLPLLTTSTANGATALRA